jgi:anthranilate synthase
LPPELKVTAISHDGVIMGIEHKTLPIAAVQFHPESIMTLAGEVGLKLVKNITSTYAKSAPELQTLQIRDGQGDKETRRQGENEEPISSSLTTNH